MDYGEERVSASSQEREMPINLNGLAEGHLGRSGTCKGALHKKETKDVSNFDKFVTEGNEKADELAKEGALLHEGFWAEARANTLQQERKDENAALQHAASFHCFVEQWKDCEELNLKPKEKWIFVDRKREEMKHRTEWCAGGQKIRISRKEFQRLLNKFEMEYCMRERGALPKEERDVIREYKAMHEENFLSSWPREDVKERKKKENWKRARRPKEERGKKRRREAEKEENSRAPIPLLPELVLGLNDVSGSLFPSCCRLLLGTPARG